MTERDKLDKLLTELQNTATDISLELSKESNVDDPEILMMEQSIENLVGHVSSQAYQLRTLRRVLREEDTSFSKQNRQTEDKA